MTSLVWLDDDTPLPHPDKALPEGLLAVGGGLSVARLTEAYSKGVFPWFSEDDPVLWWSPDPRMVLACADFHASSSLRKKLRQIARNEAGPTPRVQVLLNTAFVDVIRACADTRQQQGGTWISPEIQQAYLRWHRQGGVHSVETWIDGQLAGGLYGVSMGGFFFGESMFSHVSDASKIALAYLVAYLQRHNVQHIDCQQETGHLASLGAKPVPRTRFLTWLDQALTRPKPGWGSGQLLADGQLKVVSGPG